MNEVEVKVLNINIEAIKKKILSLGGHIVKKENQENHFYNFPSHMANCKGCIRIRKTTSLLDGSEKTYLCIKKMLSQKKTRIMEENELQVPGFKSADDFLKALDIKHNCLVKKYRESYKLLNALIEIDIWDKETFPEPYIEIEGASEEKIKEILSILEIPFDKATSKSLDEIKKEMGLI